MMIEAVAFLALTAQQPSPAQQAADMQRIMQDSQAQQKADEMTQAAIRRRYAQQTDENGTPAPKAAPEAAPARQNDAGPLLPSRMRQTVPTKGGEPPSFWQRHPWAWPALEWLSFLWLAGLAIYFARKRRGRRADVQD